MHHRKGSESKILSTKSELVKYHPLDIDHSGRVFTKHYSNLCYTLTDKQRTLFNWLCFESTGYNVFTYSTSLIKKYGMYVRALRKKYKVHNLSVAPYDIRRTLIELIEMGAIFNTEVRKEMFINPNLTYRPKWFNGKVYREYLIGYNAAVDRNDTEMIKITNQFAIDTIKLTQKIYKKR